MKESSVGKTEWLGGKMRCPYCEGDIYVGHFFDEQVKVGSIGHTHPFCYSFKHMSPVQFIQPIAQRIMDKTDPRNSPIKG